MKTLTTLVLMIALIVAPIRESRASVVAGVCLIIIVAVVATGVSVKVKACGPKWYCVEKDGSKFSAPMTRREIAMNEWVVLCGPYDTRAKLLDACTPCYESSTAPQQSNLSFPVTVHIETSTNLINWTEIASQEVDPDNFEFDFTNSVSQATCYYRAWF